jgi:hypothetical protein
VRVLGVRLNGKMIDEVDDYGRAITGSTLLVLFSAEDHPIDFVLPEIEDDRYWHPVLDTSGQPQPPKHLPGGYRYPLHPRSVAVLERKRFFPKILASYFRRRWKKNAPQPSLRIEPEEPMLSPATTNPTKRRTDHRTVQRESLTWVSQILVDEAVGQAVIDRMIGRMIVRHNRQHAGVGNDRGDEAVIHQLLPWGRAKLNLHRPDRNSSSRPNAPRAR